MRRDLIIGILLSLSIHLGMFYGDKLIKFKPKPKPVAEAAPVIKLIEMPPLEPEEPEKVITDEEPPKPMDFAPPMLTDVPQIAPPDAFVQRMQPPPPPDMARAENLVVIPANRDVGNFAGQKIFDPNMLDTQPDPTLQGKPQYPFEMRRAGIAGEVVVDFIVTPDGSVANAFSLRSSQREFEAEAIKAVSKWRFKPGRKGGRAVPTHMQVPIVFTLNDE